MLLPPGGGGVDPPSSEPQQPPLASHNCVIVKATGSKLFKDLGLMIFFFIGVKDKHDKISKVVNKSIRNLVKDYPPLPGGGGGVGPPSSQQPPLELHNCGTVKATGSKLFKDLFLLLFVFIGVKDKYDENKQSCEQSYSQPSERSPSITRWRWRWWFWSSLITTTSFGIA